MASNEPAAGARTSGCRSGLERVLRTDAFAVTAELVPPLSSDAKAVADSAHSLAAALVKAYPFPLSPSRPPDLG